jgi:protein arginine N-methyltransferase 3
MSDISREDEERHSDSSFDEADDQDWADWVDDEDVSDAQHARLASGAGGSKSGSGNITYDPLSTSAGPSSTGAGQGSFRVPTRALFADEQGQYQIFDSPMAALRRAKEQEGCDVVAVVKKLGEYPETYTDELIACGHSPDVAQLLSATGLDALQVIRLVNHIRRNNLPPAAVSGLTGAETFLNDDSELRPVAGLEDDGLLQLDFDELEVQGEAGQQGASESASTTGKQHRVQELEEELAAMRLAFEDLRKQYSSRIGLDLDSAAEGTAKGKSRASETSPIAGSSRTHNSFESATGVPGKRDDDTHYFNSYASNDIHQTMLEDSVRTLTYAKFLLSPRNAAFIRGKTIMDVGCGSGILSLFCARAGAKEVLAIDASDVADRARGNIEANGWGHVVKVKKGKLEDLGEELKPYEGKVDLIVSEWMVSGSEMDSSDDGWIWGHRLTVAPLPLSLFTGLLPPLREHAPLCPRRKRSLLESRHGSSRSFALPHADRRRLRRRLPAPTDQILGRRARLRHASHVQGSRGRRLHRGSHQGQASQLHRVRL